MYISIYVFDSKIPGLQTWKKEETRLDNFRAWSTTTRFLDQPCPILKYLAATFQ